MVETKPFSNEFAGLLYCNNLGLLTALCCTVTLTAASTNLAPNSPHTAHAGALRNVRIPKGKSKGKRTRSTFRTCSNLVRRD